MRSNIDETNLRAGSLIKGWSKIFSNWVKKIKDIKRVLVRRKYYNTLFLQCVCFSGGVPSHESFFKGRILLFEKVFEFELPILIEFSNSKCRSFDF